MIFFANFETNLAYASKPQAPRSSWISQTFIYSFKAKNKRTIYGSYSFCCVWFDSWIIRGLWQHTRINYCYSNWRIAGLYCWKEHGGSLQRVRSLEFGVWGWRLNLKFNWVLELTSNLKSQTIKPQTWSLLPSVQLQLFLPHEHPHFHYRRNFR